MPPTLRRIYKEIIDCFNLESYTLCAAGLRAIVEGVCADQGVKSGPVEVTKSGGVKAIVRKKDLEGKISGLHDKGVLTKTHADMLHELRFLGNEAVHELDQSSANELTLAIDIIHHILDALYEIPEKAETLRDNKARRKKKRTP